MYFVILCALSIIAVLGFYAGSLLFKLKQQNDKRQQVTASRIENITESVEIIAKAIEQQQCEVSEGAIRICRLLEALPLSPQPDFRKKFPAIFDLFIAVSGFAILEERKKLSKSEIRKQDKARLEIESEHETSVLKELPDIIQFCQGL